MSVPVVLDRLREEVYRFGLSPYLLTVTADGRPHAVSVTVVWDGDELAASAGRTTLANARERPAVSLLWPPTERGGYALILDGVARAETDRVSVRPTSAVLHRSAAGPEGIGPPQSDCVPVLRP